MRILLINLPYMGHVIPTVGLVQELTRAGHGVMCLLPRNWEPVIAPGGGDFLGYDDAPKLDVQIRNAFRTAETVIRDCDLVLYEQFFFLGKHLAEKYGKPCARIFTAPATNRALMRDFLSHGGPMGIFRLPFIARLWTADAIKGLGIRLKCGSWLDEILENPPRCNLVYTLPEFQPFREDFPEEHFHFLGPSVYRRPQEALSLPEGRTVYISLGSILGGSRDFYRGCVEAFRDWPGPVVMALGGQTDPECLGPLPEHFLVRQRLPQWQVLERAALFVTHGGMNSVSEAMALGVPMVVIPFVSDQPVNAAQVEKLGLGRVLLPKAVTARRLRETAEAVLGDETIRAKVCQMRRRIVMAPGNTGAVKILEEYLERETAAASQRQ